MGKEIVIQVQESPGNPIQDKPKEKHTKTHINQTNKSYQASLIAQLVKNQTAMLETWV